MNCGVVPVLLPDRQTDRQNCFQLYRIDVKNPTNWIYHTYVEAGADKSAGKKRKKKDGYTFKIEHMI